MKTFKKFDLVLPSDQGMAVKLRFMHTDGTGQELEIIRDDLHQWLDALLKTAQALGEKVANATPLIEQDLNKCVSVPVEDLQTRSVLDGALWLMLRVGSQDLCVGLPSPKARCALAKKLGHGCPD